MIKDDKTLFPNISQWQQYQLQSQSQLTLVNFNSNLSQNQLKQQNMLSNILDKYTISQRVNFIINRDKGLIININNGNVVQRFAGNGNHQDNLQYLNIAEYQQNIKNKKYIKRQSKYCSLHIKYQNNGFLCIDQIPDNIWDDYWEQTQAVHRKLLMSICQKNNKIFEDLFNKKINHYPININYKSYDNWTPIHYAALHGNNFALQILLNNPQTYINSLTNFKLSALHVATKNNKGDSVNLLLKYGIQSNYQDQDGNTALHYAAELGHKDIVSMLLKHKKINFNLKNNKGLIVKQMTTSNDIIKLFKAVEKDNNNQNQGKFFTNLRNNRHIQKLLMKVNQNHIKNIKIQQEENKTPIKKDSNTSNKSTPNRIQGKRENIVRMYQLLKENKSTQKIGLESFKFYRKIGEGAFGEVYIVKKGRSQKFYALKAIRKQKIMGNSILRYIQTEKQVLSLIKHPFIVKLHYAFQTEAYLFLVMDYCQGGDLGKYLQKKKNFDQQTVKYYGAEILLALQALHKQKIIYRDLKPDNIVLDQQGHALLTDFGLSKKTTSIDDINRSFCGTPAYLPLQIINKKGHNRMADWYEYGIVLYELFTGIPPFYAETRAELYQNVRAGVIKFPRNTPQAFKDIIKKLLSQNPQKRLGYVDDAQSIKQHPWFIGINWEDVYNKKLKMPKILNKVLIGQPIKSKFTDQKSQKNLIPDWSFIAS